MGAARYGALPASVSRGATREAVVVNRIGGGRSLGRNWCNHKPNDKQQGNRRMANSSVAIGRPTPPRRVVFAQARPLPGVPVLTVVSGERESYAKGPPPEVLT